MHPGAVFYVPDIVLGLLFGLWFGFGFSGF